MDDLLSGLVVAVSSIPVGTQTVGDAAIGADALVVDDVIDFNPTGGQVAIDGTVVDYIETDDDTDTMTLASPLTALLAAGADVAPYPARVETTAMVLIEGTSDPIPATVPWSLQDALKVGVRDEADREKVRLTRDGEWSWMIHDLPEQPLERDGIATYRPRIWATKGSSTAITSGSWQTVTGWFVYRSDRITLDGLSNQFRVEADGEYDIRVGVSFSSGGSNNRSVRMHYYDEFGNDAGVSRRGNSPSDGITVVETAQIRPLRAGQTFAFEAWQNSGGTLDILGSNIFTAPPVTDCSIRWVGPL